MRSRGRSADLHNSQFPKLRERLFQTYLWISFFLIVPVLNNSAIAQQTYRMSKAPFYKTFDKKSTLTSETHLMHLPVQIDKMTNEEFFYQGREAALQPVITVLNQYLDSLNWSTAVAWDNFPDKDNPYLFVGSSESVIAPPAAEMLREDFDKFPPMAMHIDKPGREWKTVLQQHMAHNSIDFAMIFWLGFNEYPKANKGLFKKKVVLGTDYEPEIRFLSDELEPVEVLQITGMLVDKKGNIIRAGAEAFLYEDSPFWVQVLEASTAIDDKTLIRSATDIRRDDLPGKPLAWKVAMYNLIRQLTQRPVNYSSI